MGEQFELSAIVLNWLAIQLLTKKELLRALFFIYLHWLTNFRAAATISVASENTKLLDNDLILIKAEKNNNQLRMKNLLYLRY